MCLGVVVKLFQSCAPLWHKSQSSKFSRCLIKFLICRNIPADEKQMQGGFQLTRRRPSRHCGLDRNLHRSMFEFNVLNPCFIYFHKCPTSNNQGTLKGALGDAVLETNLLLRPPRQLIFIMKYVSHAFFLFHFLLKQQSVIFCTLKCSLIVDR